MSDRKDVTLQDLMNLMWDEMQNYREGKTSLQTLKALVRTANVIMRAAEIGFLLKNNDGKEPKKLTT